MSKGTFSTGGKYPSKAENSHKLSLFSISRLSCLSNSSKEEKLKMSLVMATLYIEKHLKKWIKIQNLTLAN